MLINIRNTPQKLASLLNLRQIVINIPTAVRINKTAKLAATDTISRPENLVIRQNTVKRILKETVPGMWHIRAKKHQIIAKSETLTLIC